MTNQLCIQAFSPATSRVLFWYLTINKEGVCIQTDAVTKSCGWMEHFKIMNGRYELTAVFYTQEEYRRVKGFIPRLLSLFSFSQNVQPVKKGICTARGTLKKELTPVQKDMLHLLQTFNTYKKAAMAGNYTEGAITKAMSRLREEYGVHSTKELIAVLVAEGLL